MLSHTAEECLYVLVKALKHLHLPLLVHMEEVYSRKLTVEH